MAQAGRKDRALGALLGLAVGDAVGTTLEFVDRDSRPALTDMIGGGPFGLEPGQWTDDTSMALCLADCLIADKGEVEPRHLLAHFVNWWRLGVNSVTGTCFDIGGATSSALRKFELHGTVENNPEDHLQANGSIMRLSPVVLGADSRERACALALVQGQTTHAAAVPAEGKHGVKHSCRDALTLEGRRHADFVDIEFAHLVWMAVDDGSALADDHAVGQRHDHEMTW